MDTRGSTGELFHGTSKSTRHLPGYSGFIPSSAENSAAAGQGVASGKRAGTKGIRLMTLMQYPHNLPGYCGYRPQSVVNDADPVRDHNSSSNSAALEGAGCFEPGRLGLSQKVENKMGGPHSQAGIRNAMH